MGPPGSASKKKATRAKPRPRAKVPPAGSDGADAPSDQNGVQDEVEALERRLGSRPRADADSEGSDSGTGSGTEDGSASGSERSSVPLGHSGRKVLQRERRELFRLRRMALALTTDRSTQFRAQLSEAARRGRSTSTPFSWEDGEGSRTRLAPQYLAQVYGENRTLVDHARRVLTERDLAAAHEADSYMLAAAAVDALFSKDGVQVLKSEAVELLCRRFWSFERATEDTKGLDMMKKQRNVLRAVYAAIDVAPTVAGGIRHEAAEAEMKREMKRATLLAAALKAAGPG